MILTKKFLFLIIYLKIFEDLYSEKNNIILNNNLYYYLFNLCIIFNFIIDLTYIIYFIIYYFYHFIKFIYNFVYKYKNKCINYFDIYISLLINENNY
jgi:hypothetical protein